jgi:hypothetical protein
MAEGGGLLIDPQLQPINAFDRLMLGDSVPGSEEEVLTLPSPLLCVEVLGRDGDLGHCDEGIFPFVPFETGRLNFGLDLARQVRLRADPDLEIEHDIFGAGSVELLRLSCSQVIGVTTSSSGEAATQKAD